MRNGQGFPLRAKNCASVKSIKIEFRIQGQMDSPDPMTELIQRVKELEDQMDDVIETYDKKILVLEAKLALLEGGKQWTVLRFKGGKIEEL